MLSDYLKVNIVMIQADKGIRTYGKENLYERRRLNQHHNTLLNITNTANVPF